MIKDTDKITEYSTYEENGLYKIKLNINGITHFRIYYRNDKELFLEDLNQLIEEVGI